MIDPFTAWSRMVAAGLEMQSTWLRGVETLQASQTVIDVRSDKLRDAVSSPMSADLAEFSRMVPEKLDAFGRSATAVTRDAIAMYRAWTVQMQRLGRMMMLGRLPTFSEATVFANQSGESALAAMTSGSRVGRDALAPVHKAATGNARRLTRARKR